MEKTDFKKHLDKKNQVAEQVVKLVFAKVPDDFYPVKVDVFHNLKSLVGF